MSQDMKLYTIDDVIADVIETEGLNITISCVDIYRQAGAVFVIKYSDVYPNGTNDNACVRDLQKRVADFLRGECIKVKYQYILPQMDHAPYEDSFATTYIAVETSDNVILVLDKRTSSKEEHLKYIKDNLKPDMITIFSDRTVVAHSIMIH